MIYVKCLSVLPHNYFLITFKITRKSKEMREKKRRQEVERIRFTRELENDFEFITKNQNVLLGLMGFCTVLIWKGFDLFPHGTKIDDSNQLFFSSFVLACIGMLLLGITFLSIILNKNYHSRKPLCSVSFLYSISSVLISTVLLVLQVLNNVIPYNLFASYFTLAITPLFLLFFVIHLLIKIKKYDDFKK